MIPKRVCGKCGAVLTGVGEEELCPGCLLEGGLALGLDREPAAAESAIHNPPPAIASGFPRPFGDYELLEEIARGGMGIVYRARQVSLDRIVAVKMLLFGPLASPPDVQRFRTEAAAAASLQHPNIVSIHEVGFREGQHFFAMDYVPGRSLAEIVRDGPLPARQAAGYLKTLAETIQYAHERGILHRDLKPSNVLIDENDQLRVTDFGLAKRLEKDTELTLSGHVLGSPNYMPPEQAAAHRGLMGKRSDVYSLGAILYHLLTGRAPFVAPTVAETLQQVRNAEPVSPTALNPHLLRDLKTICLKCLEKEPARRFETAQELADELNRFLNGEPILARPISGPEMVWRWCRRKPAVASLTAALGGALLLGISAVTWQWRLAEQHAKLEKHLRRNAEIQQEDIRRLAAETRGKLAQLNVANGLQLLEEGDRFGSLLWLAEALKLDSNEPDKTANQRLRFSTILRLSPKLHQMWFHDGLRERELSPGDPSSPNIVSLWGLDGAVNAAVFSADGRMIASAGQDGAACVWEAGTGKLLFTLTHTGHVDWVGFSPNGRILVTGGHQGVQLWDSATGQSLFRLKDPDVHLGELNRDGSRLVTASRDGTLKVWDLTTGELALPAIRCRGTILDVGFSPDGQRFVIAGWDRLVQIRDVATGKEVCPPLRHNQTVRDVAFSPDGSRLATANWANTVHVWNVATGQELYEPIRHRAMVSHVAFSPDGKFVVSSSQDRTAKVFEAATGREVMSLLGHSQIVLESNFTPDGTRIITRSMDGTVRVWDARTGLLALPPLRHGGLVSSAVLHPDGRRLLTASWDGTVRLWDLASDEISSSPWKDEELRIVSVLGQGNMLVTQDSSAQVRLWETTTWKPMSGVIAETDRVMQARMSTSGERLLTIAEAAGSALKVKTWEIPSGRLASTVLVPVEEASQWACNSDLSVIAVTAGQTISAYDIRSTNLLWRDKPTMNGFLQEPVFSPDGAVLIATSASKIFCFKTATGQQMFSPLSHSTTVSHAEFSPDGHYLIASCTDDSYRKLQAQIWDMATGKRHLSPFTRTGHVNFRIFSPDGDELWTGYPSFLPSLGHEDGVTFASFSSDGAKVLTGSEDRTARLWDAHTGQPLTPYLRHGQVVIHAALSPDSRWMVTVSRREARIWDVTTGEPLTPPLTQEGDIEEAFFVGKGDCLLTVGHGMATKWDLSPSQISVEDAVAWAHLMSSHRIDSTGALEPLHGPELSVLWQTMRSK